MNTYRSVKLRETGWKFCDDADWTDPSGNDLMHLTALGGCDEMPCRTIGSRLFNVILTKSQVNWWQIINWPYLFSSICDDRTNCPVFCKRKMNSRSITIWRLHHVRWYKNMWQMICCHPRSSVNRGNWSIRKSLLRLDSICGLNHIRSQCRPIRYLYSTNE